MVDDKIQPWDHLMDGRPVVFLLLARFFGPRKFGPVSYRPLYMFFPFFLLSLLIYWFACVLA